MCEAEVDNVGLDDVGGSDVITNYDWINDVHVFTVLLCYVCREGWVKGKQIYKPSARHCTVKYDVNTATCCWPSTLINWVSNAQAETTAVVGIDCKNALHCKKTAC